MIGFRVDANEKIATGHLMRCIALAEACREQGEECAFFLAEDKETERLRVRGLPYRILGTKWERMEDEIPVIEQMLREERLDWLVVDSYQATAAYLSHLQRKVPVLYIDDLRKEQYDVSVVLQYIAGEQQWINTPCSGAERPVYLQGFAYAPLRKEFAMLPDAGKRERSILITTGGTDAYNIAGRVLKHCQCLTEYRDYLFHVIVGSMNHHEEELQKLAERNPHIRLHKNVTDIDTYMKRCEVALSAGGTTLLELCACQIPTVCVSFAENQKSFARGMGEKGVMRYAGDARENGQIEKEICRQLLFFMSDINQRNFYAERMGNLVDGRGAERIAAFLSENIRRKIV
ncbi:MAG: UDP-2,4-diacetamido-2,4,6-trideoxy-beta-L-altropyranose hydrolase [Roseburia sp.]